MKKIQALMDDSTINNYNFVIEDNMERYYSAKLDANSLYLKDYESVPSQPGTTLLSGNIIL